MLLGVFIAGLSFVLVGCSGRVQGCGLGSAVLMLVNAILHQKVAGTDENQAKFLMRRCLVGSSVASVLAKERVKGRYAGIKSRLMSELNLPDDQAGQSRGSGSVSSEAGLSDASGPAMFASKRAQDSGMPLAACAVAGLVVLVILAGLLIATRRKPAAPKTVQPLASYAANLPLSQLAMSESTSLSGGKSTFIDGTVKNTGTQTVTAVTVQVLFRNDEGMPPAVETEPLSLIRTREPYVDTEPVSAAPLKPEDQAAFRLIFEAIPANWNSEMPEIHVIDVGTK